MSNNFFLHFGATHIKINLNRQAGKLKSMRRTCSGCAPHDNHAACDNIFSSWVIDIHTANIAAYQILPLHITIPTFGLLFREK